MERIQSVTPLSNFGERLSFWRLPRTFADNFSKILDASGVTGRSVAQLTGIVESQISDYRTGKVAEPGLFTVIKLAKALGCTVEDLVGGIDDEYDSVRDLIRQHVDQQSGSSSHVGDSLNDTAAVGVELEHLRQRVAEYDQEVRKMRSLADDLFTTAIALEKIRTASTGTTARSSDDRKTG